MLVYLMTEGTFGLDKPNDDYMARGRHLWKLAKYEIVSIQQTEHVQYLFPENMCRTYHFLEKCFSTMAWVSSEAWAWLFIHHYEKWSMKIEDGPIESHRTSRARICTNGCWYTDIRTCVSGITVTLNHVGPQRVDAKGSTQRTSKSVCEQAK